MLARHEFATPIECRDIVDHSQLKIERLNEREALRFAENLRMCLRNLHAFMTSTSPRGIAMDSYLVDFLNLPEGHSEQELQAAIITNLRRFLGLLAGHQSSTSRARISRAVPSCSCS
jgi:predicted nuclease of restriction endonuclease-like (RecB) superfamily